MKPLRVASVQFQHAPHDPSTSPLGLARGPERVEGLRAGKNANLATIRRFVETAAADNVQLICFPECCITGYWTLRKLDRAALVKLAEPVPDGPSSQALAALAREHDMIVAAGLVEITDDHTMFNTFVVALPDGAVHRHRKIHCFISEHLASGGEYTVFDTPLGWKVGVLTCYDNNLIENCRMTALMGADVLLAPHQTGGCASRSPHAMGLVDRKLWDNRENDPAAIEAELAGPKGRGWLMRWLPSRAHDNGMFLVFANGVGPDDDEIRTGNAMILDCYGRVLAETCKAGDDMVIADLDPGLLDNCTGRRWITTRRPELYEPIAKPTGREVDTRTSRFDAKGI
ncbi:MAG TPA: nitrilase family protein [Planctomycetota bacterium]|nr:nitrilase family protein [Planctomycetota bacterium]